MNKYWPKQWNKALPNFLGEDFFSSFQDFFDEEDEESNRDNNRNTNHNITEDNTSNPNAPTSNHQPNQPNNHAQENPGMNPSHNSQTNPNPDPNTRSNHNQQRNLNQMIQKNNDQQVSNVVANIYESNNEVLCIFRLPGLKLKEVDIRLYGVTLEINGKVHVEETGYRLIHNEIYEGPVHRRVTLPIPVRDDKIEASYNHGYLIIRLHRLIQPGEKPKSITIKDLENQ